MVRGTVQARTAPAGAAGNGGRLAGRYRLDKRLTDENGSAVWRATDEALALTVTVRTFAPGFRCAPQATAAARAVSRLADPRVLRVFDADDGPGCPYLVTEWPPGIQLGQLLAAGPVEPGRAARLIAEAADALAGAHAAGLCHLRLGPDSLWCTVEGGVRISGLGTAAALAGVSVADPARADTHALAALLYAALTGYWPGPGRAGLPAAPASGGRPCRPSQLAPGVPACLDNVTCRALSGEAGRGGPAILGPAQLAMELGAATGAGRPSPGPPVHAPAPGTRAGPAAPAAATLPDLPVPGFASGPAPVPAPPAGVPTRAPMGLIIATALLALAVIGLAGWILAHWAVH
jgi:serine/threonine protein kinase